MNQNTIASKSSDIVIFHIGGSLGTYGPIDTILKCFPKKCIVYAFEARDETSDQFIKVEMEDRNVRLIQVNACISDKKEEVQLYVNKRVESSSMLPPDKRAINFHSLYFPSGIYTWGENTELDYQIKLKAISLEAFIKEQNLTPDVLSIDAQGMELRILQGTGAYLQDITAIVSEVEFVEVYAGQGLFDGQMSLLQKHGMRLADVFSRQDWYPGPVIGKGLYTVDEALWIKNIESYIDEPNTPNYLMRGIKLAAIAYAYELYSYSYKLLESLETRFGDKVLNLCESEGFEVLSSLKRKVDAGMASYRENKYFFLDTMSNSKASEKSEPNVNRPIRRFISRGLRKVGRKVLRLFES